VGRDKDRQRVGKGGKAAQGAGTNGFREGWIQVDVVFLVVFIVDLVFFVLGYTAAIY